MEGQSKQPGRRRERGGRRSDRGGGGKRRVQGGRKIREDRRGIRGKGTRSKKKADDRVLKVGSNVGKRRKVLIANFDYWRTLKKRR